MVDKKKKTAFDIARERNSTNKISDAPKPEPKPEPTPTGRLKSEPFRDERTGELSGITIPTGETFLGLSPDEVKGVSEREFGTRQTPIGSESPEERKARKDSVIQSQELQQKEQALAAIPVPRSEPIEETTAQPFQEIGKGIITGETTLGQALIGGIGLKELKELPGLQDQILKLTKDMTNNNLTPEQITSDPILQDFLRLKLTERDIKVLNEGKADVNDMAILIEGLPVTGTFTKITGGALTPTTAISKIKSLDKKVSDITSKMDNWSEAISKNPQLAEKYDDLIDDAEQEILNAQSRIKLMIIQSPILQNSPEEVELISENLDKGLIKTTKLRSQVVQTRFIQ